MMNRHSWQQRRARGRAPKGARCIAALLLVCMCPLALSATLEMAIRPVSPISGETARLLLTSKRSLPQVEKLPEVKGLEWLSEAAAPQQSVRMAWLQGERVRMASAVYSFRVQERGEYRIPPLKVRVDEQVFETEAHTFTAVRPQVQTDQGQMMDLESALFTRFTFDGNATAPEEVYLGESMKITLNVYVLESAFSSIAYPEVAMDNAVFRDYSAENPRFPRFRTAEIRKMRIDERTFVQIPFRFVLSAIKPGPLTGRLTTTCEIETIRSIARSGLDSSLLRRRVRSRRRVVAELPDIAVRPLPTAPEDQHFLGLVGDWKASLKLASKEVRVGESLSLILTVAGQGPLELLSPPKLDPPGFRVYEAEVERQSRGNTAFATLTWVLVPLQEDSRLPPMTFSTFDPVAEKYRAREWTGELTVLPARQGANGGLIVDAGTGERSSNNPESDSPRSDILYVKKTAAKTLPTPLWQRSLPFLLLGALGPGAYLLLLLASRHRQRMEQDRGYRRRATAARERQHALKKLRNCDREERGKIIREELTPALTAGLGLPPGTTPTELAAHVQGKSPELADQFRRAEESRYLPDQNEKIDVALVARQAANLFAWALLFVLSILPAQAAGPPRGDLLNAARAAYDRGQIEEALNTYRAVSEQEPRNPGLLYNRANCQYRLGQGGKAVALYERARRLAPRDPDIAENLRFVRRQLGLPNRSKVRNPFDLLARLRDSLRPDEWLILGAWLLFLWGVLGGVLHFRAGPPRWLHWLAGIVLLICLGAVGTQFRGPYRRGEQAVVVRAAAELLRLPDSNAKALSVELREGQQIEVVERRSDWTRIRIGQDEGWIHRRDIDIIW